MAFNVTYRSKFPSYIKKFSNNLFHFSTPLPVLGQYSWRGQTSGDCAYSSHPVPCWRLPCHWKYTPSPHPSFWLGVSSYVIKWEHSSSTLTLGITLTEFLFQLSRKAAASKVPRTVYYICTGNTDGSLLNRLLQEPFHSARCLQGRQGRGQTAHVSSLLSEEEIRAHCCTRPNCTQWPTTLLWFQIPLWHWSFREHVAWDLCLHDPSVLWDILVWTTCRIPFEWGRGEDLLCPLSPSQGHCITVVKYDILINS